MSGLSLGGARQEEFDAGLDAMFDDMDQGINQVWSAREAIVLDATTRLNKATHDQMKNAMDPKFRLSDAA